MDGLKIYSSIDDERSEAEVILKEYRTDIYVEIKDKVFNLSLFTILRLTQDYQSQLDSKGYYDSEINLIIVKSTDKHEIINTIIRLSKGNYFQLIKPEDNIDLSRLVQVYPL